MKMRPRTTLVLASVTVGLTTYGLVIAEKHFPAGAMIVTPAELKWRPVPPTPGWPAESATILGDEEKPGIYIVRHKWAPHVEETAHSHSDTRYYVVVSGTWYTTFGDKYDPKKLHPAPAGTFYLVPANTPHFGATKDDGAIIQIIGMGPSKATDTEPVVDPKKK